MCGRYTSTMGEKQLLDVFDIEPDNADPIPPPDYNVAPTKHTPVVIEHGRHGQPAHRQVRNLVWGLVPSWSKQPRAGARMINARAETVHERPAYRAAFKSRRAIIPAGGFYEWFPTDEVGKSGRPLKQPFYIESADADFLALGGLYEFWRNREAAADEHAEWLITFTIITTDATDDVGHIHDRMPVVIAPENWDDWLDPTIDDIDYLRTLMAPPPAGSLHTYPISTLVNNVANNGPDLLKPLDQ